MNTVLAQLTWASVAGAEGVYIGLSQKQKTKE
jgi:hypothetical protein